MAEKEGFEPSISFWDIHDFQSCALGRTTRLLHVRSNCVIQFSFVIINEGFQKVKHYFWENGGSAVSVGFVTLQMAE